MILIADMLERFTVCLVVAVVYPAIRVAEIFLGRNFLDD